MRKKNLKNEKLPKLERKKDGITNPKKLHNCKVALFRYHKKTKNDHIELSSTKSNIGKTIIGTFAAYPL